MKQRQVQIVAQAEARRVLRIGRVRPVSLHLLNVIELMIMIATLSVLESSAMFGVSSRAKIRLKAVPFVVSLVLAAAPGAKAMEKTISVVIDKAHLVDLPQGTATLIIGNPTIADVTMLGTRGSLMVLTPKSFGETNFIALDSAGKPLSESIIRVVGGSDTLIVQRGMERQSYACAPRCQATEKLGDDNKFFADTIAQKKTYSQSVSSSSPPISGSTVGSPQR